MPDDKQLEQTFEEAKRTLGIVERWQLKNMLNKVAKQLEKQAETAESLREKIMESTKYIDIYEDDGTPISKESLAKRDILQLYDIYKQLIDKLKTLV